MNPITRTSMIDPQQLAERTTVERIAALKSEVGRIRRERDQVQRSVRDRIHAMEEAMLRPAYAPLLSVAATGSAAVAAFGLLSTAQPNASALSAQTLAYVPEARTAILPTALPTVLQTSAESRASAGTGAQPERGLETAAEPAPRTAVASTRAKRSSVRRPATRSKAATRVAPKSAPKVAAPAVRPAPTLDPLAGMDDCGDDPICGL